MTENPEAINQVYNVAVHARTTLNQLFEMLRSRLEPHYHRQHRPTPYKEV